MHDYGITDRQAFLKSPAYLRRRTEEFIHRAGNVALVLYVIASFFH